LESESFVISHHGSLGTILQRGNWRGALFLRIQSHEKITIPS
jgi:hypothetical protein